MRRSKCLCIDAGGRVEDDAPGRRECEHAVEHHTVEVQVGIDGPWILPPLGRSVLRDRLDAQFVHAGVQPPINVVETTSLPVITNLLQATDCVAALQQGTVSPYLAARMLVVLPIALGIKMEPFGIVTRRDHLLSPGAEAMLDALRAVAGSMYERAGPGAPKGPSRPRSSKDRHFA